MINKKFKIKLKYHEKHRIVEYIYSNGRKEYEPQKCLFVFLFWYELLSC